MFPLFYDPTMIILIPAMILAVYAQSKVKGTYEKYRRVYNKRGITGAQVAQDIMRRNGLNLPIEMISGVMTDHYDPRSKVLRLSSEVYNGTSVASCAIAAHEVGHAIQDDREYYPLRFRNSLVPVANIGSQLSMIFIMVGLFIPRLLFFLDIGILLFTAAVLFQIVTLPVEFNASSRAIDQLEEVRVFDADELKMGKKVLDAAALTYVAATVSAISQLIRLLIIRDSRDD